MELSIDEMMVAQMAKSLDYMSDEDMANWSYETASNWVKDQKKYESETGTPLPYNVEDVYDTVKAMIETL